MLCKQKLVSKIVLLATLLCCAPEVHAQERLLTLMRQPISYVTSFAKQHPVFTAVGGCFALWAGYRASKYAAKKWKIWNRCRQARVDVFWFRNDCCAEVQSGENFEGNLAIASSAFASDDSYVRAQALRLFDALFEQGLGFDEAVAAAVRAFDADRATRVQGCRSYGGSKSSDALKLLSKVVNQGHGFREARKVVMSALRIFDPGVYDDADSLLQDLIIKDASNCKNILEEALDLASQDFQSPDITSHEKKELTSRLINSSESQSHSYPLTRHVRGYELFRFLFGLGLHDEIKQSLYKTALASALQVLEHPESFTIEYQDKQGIHKKGVLAQPFVNALDILANLVSSNYAIGDAAVRLCLDILSDAKRDQKLHDGAHQVISIFVRKGPCKAQVIERLRQMGKEIPSDCKDLEFFLWKLSTQDSCSNSSASSFSSSSSSSSSTARS